MKTAQDTQIVDAITGRYDDVTAQDVDETIEDIEELKKQGKLFTERSVFPDRLLCPNSASP